MDRPEHPADKLKRFWEEAKAAPIPSEPNPYSRSGAWERYWRELKAWEAWRRDHPEAC